MLQQALAVASQDTGGGRMAQHKRGGAQGDAERPLPFLLPEVTEVRGRAAKPPRTVVARADAVDERTQFVDRVTSISAEGPRHAGSHALGEKTAATFADGKGEEPKKKNP